MLPNLIIAGAPKSGTTSVFHWLADHPDVCASTRKEVQYFMDRDSSVFHKEANFLDHGLKTYHSFFKNYQEDQHEIVLEATPGYIYQKAAIENIGSKLPDTKLIFILREPASRLNSIFRYFSQNRGELTDDIDLATFVKMIETQDQSLLWNEFLKDAILHGQYIDYLLAWEQRCGKDRMMVLVYEDLMKDAQQFMITLSKEIGLDADFYQDYPFEAKNKSVKINNRLIHGLVKGLSSVVPFGESREKLKKIYFSLNASAKTTERPPSVDNTIQYLKDHYSTYNQKLAQHFDLDLSSWM